MSGGVGAAGDRAGGSAADATGEAAPAVAPVAPVAEDSRGIVQPAAGLRAFTLDRFPPAPDVARFVDRYWIVAWDLPPGRSYRSQVLVHPVVNIVFDGDDVTVGGVDTGRFSRVLEGRGRALGIMFRPGGFHVFLDAPLSTLTDRSVPLHDIPALAGLEDVVRPLFRAEPEIPGRAVADAVDAFLAARVPADPQPSEKTVAWADLAVHDRGLTRVEDLAAAAGVSTRTLQRAFTEHVGIGPKWFLRRYRIYEAAERVARQEHVDWSDLAADLGYSDQAHLTRDFTAAVGQPPAQYAAAARRAPAGESG